MSLTQDDLQQIRAIVQDTFRPLDGEIKALREDIKELYSMVVDLQKQIAGLDRRAANLEGRAIVIDENFQKLPAKEQILHMHAVIVALAKKEGIVLPR